MTQTIIPPAKAETPPAEPDKKGSEANDPEPPTEPTTEPQTDDKDKEIDDLKRRVSDLEAAVKEGNKATLEAVSQLRAAILTGDGDDVRGDNAGDHATKPAAGKDNALAKALAMPNGPERTAYVTANAEAILRDAFAAR